MTKARQQVGPNVTLQGNLDPGYLLVQLDLLMKPPIDFSPETGNGHRHVFNLGPWYSLNNTTSNETTG